MEPKDAYGDILPADNFVEGHSHDQSQVYKDIRVQSESKSGLQPSSSNDPTNEDEVVNLLTRDFEQMGATLYVDKVT